MFDKIQIIAAVGVLLVFIVSVATYESKLSSLKSELLETTKDLSDMQAISRTCERNYKALNTTLNEVNEANEQLGAIYNDMDEKYKAEVLKPPKVRYEVLYKFIEQEVKSNEIEAVTIRINNAVNYINNGGMH